MNTFSKIKNSAFFIFLFEFLKNPRKVGAISPSSEQLARTIAKQIPTHIKKHPDNFIVEIGAGTGTITKAILASGIRTQQLIVIEQLDAMVEHLRSNFTEIRIITGNAENLIELLTIYQKNIRCIISSLPISLLSATSMRILLQQIEGILPVNGIFMQYTYHPGNSFLHTSNKFECVYSKWVWQNLPPARIDVYRKKS